MSYKAQDSDLPSNLWKVGEPDRFVRERELIRKQADSLGLIVTGKQIDLCATLLLGIQDDRDDNRQ